MTPARFFIRFIFLSAAFFLSEKAIAQNGTLDTSFHSLGTFNSEVRHIYELQDGKLLVGGRFSRFRTIQQGGIVRLHADGTLDASFNSGGHGFTSGFETVEKILVQPDGKIIIAGGFSNYNGSPTALGVMRLNSDGTRDNSFNSGGVGANVNNIEDGLLQPDGKIILVGQFTSFNSVACKYIIRFNSDGTVDPAFNVSQGADWIVRTVARQDDGKLIIGGSFNTVSGVPLRSLARLNADGTLDNSFNIGTGANVVSVNKVLIQPNGKILVGGDFQGFNGTSNRSIIRLNGDGSTDTGFNCYLSAFTSFIFTEDAMTIDNNGKILLKGLTLPSQKYNITRLNDDGSVDNTFDCPANIVYVNDIHVKSNGDVLIVGAFNEALGYAASNMILVHSDGSRDMTFLAEEGPIYQANNAGQYQVEMQKDNKILFAGFISAYGNKIVKNVVRLNRDGSQDQTFQTSTGISAAVGSPITSDLAVQKDGKIIVVGVFDTFGSDIAHNVVRLNPDGTYDASLNTVSGANSMVSSVLVLPDGKLVLAGSFTVFNGVSRNYIVKLNSDGSIDNTFNTGSGFNNGVTKIILQPDGNMLAIGGFTSYNGAPAPYVARLKSNGTIDPSFYSRSGYSNCFDIALQPGNKILLSVLPGRIIRLNPNGSIDKTFNQVVTNGRINRICVLPDEKIMIGGYFQTVNGISKTIARINPDGTLDNTFTGIFETGTAFVIDMALQHDGKLLVAGDFVWYRNSSTELPYKCNKILRLHGTPRYVNTIRGNVYREDNANCVKENTESTISYAVVKAEPGSFYGISDQYGNYAIATDTGQANYTITKERNVLQAAAEEIACPSAAYTVPLNGAFKDTCCFDFAVQSSDCSLLNISVGSASKRMCARSKTVVQYGNYGKASANGVQLMVYYPKQLLPISSVPAWSSNQGDTLLTYTIGTLLGESEQRLVIVDSVRCVNFTIGNTPCVKAHITPKSDCPQASSSWDLSDMVLNAYCNQGTVQFSIRNNGNGNMEDSLSYRIYSNDTLIFQRRYKLQTGELLKGSFTANGNAFRLEADQQAHHPGNAKEIAIVEICRSQAGAVPAYQLGHVSSVSLHDRNFEETVFCIPITGSYDPNDKSAFPAGRGNQHAILSSDVLKYSIRFQNTGNDTAYTVRIVDTLDAHFDLTTLSDIIASHPYTMELSGSDRPVLVFNFYNINLPDSTKDKSGSQGFISFNLSLRSSVTEGDQIKNKAGIYFDYNDPVLTNETLHTIDNSNEPEDLTKGTAVSIVQVVTSVTDAETTEGMTCYPNPAWDKLTVSFKNPGKYTLTILTSEGVQVERMDIDSKQAEWNVSGLKSGFYLLNAEDASGKRTIKYFVKN